MYAKRGISVNLPQLLEVGLWGPKAGLEFNRFKEPVAQHMRAWRTESQNKSYIASETYFGVIAVVTGIGHSFVILKQVQDDEEHIEIPLPQASGGISPPD